MHDLAHFGTSHVLFGKTKIQSESLASSVPFVLPLNRRESDPMFFQSWTSVRGRISVDTVIRYGYGIDGKEEVDSDTMIMIVQGRHKPVSISTVQEQRVLSGRAGCS